MVTNAMDVLRQLVERCALEQLAEIASRMDAIAANKGDAYEHTEAMARVVRTCSNLLDEQVQMVTAYIVLVDDITPKPEPKPEPAPTAVAEAEASRLDAALHRLAEVIRE